MLGSKVHRLSLSTRTYSTTCVTSLSSLLCFEWSVARKHFPCKNTVSYIDKSLCAVGPGLFNDHLKGIWI